MELRICVDVNDMERAIAFYTGGLGLEVGRRFGNDFVELLGAACPIDLLFHAAGTQAVPGSGSPRNYQRHWTPLHLDFVVNDIAAAVVRLQQLGAVLEMPVTDRAWGLIAGLADPFGHGFDLLQFQGRGYDAMSHPN
jgi:catechol 2,3-dioxygenase-like lactoylglutathione lyase family enzyme